MRTALFWAVTQRVAVLYCRRFGTTYWSHFQGSRIDSWSVGNYRYSLRQSPQERNCHADCYYSLVRHFVMNLTDVKLHACWHLMSGVNNKFVRQFCPMRGNKLKLGFITVKFITFTIYGYNKPTRCNSGSIVFINNYRYALHVSDAPCVHRLEHYKL